MVLKVLRLLPMGSGRSSSVIQYSCQMVWPSYPPNPSWCAWRSSTQWESISKKKTSTSKSSSLPCKTWMSQLWNSRLSSSKFTLNLQSGKIRTSKPSQALKLIDLQDLWSRQIPILNNFRVATIATMPSVFNTQTMATWFFFPWSFCNLLRIISRREG